MWSDRIDPAFGNWLAGFVDGEGCFFIRRNVVKYRDRSYITYGCSLSMALRDDDLATLEAIRTAIGFGSISRTHQGPRQGTRGNPSACLYISAKAEMALLVELFDRYPLRSKKARDYAIWKRAVIEWHRERGAKTRGRDWSVMAALHEELKASRRYVPLDPEGEPQRG